MADRLAGRRALELKVANMDAYGFNAYRLRQSARVGVTGMKPKMDPNTIIRVAGVSRMMAN